MRGLPLFSSGMMILYLSGLVRTPHLCSKSLYHRKPASVTKLFQQAQQEAPGAYVAPIEVFPIIQLFSSHVIEFDLPEQIMQIIIFCYWNLRAWYKFMMGELSFLIAVW